MFQILRGGGAQIWLNFKTLPVMIPKIIHSPVIISGGSLMAAEEVVINRK